MIDIIIQKKKFSKTMILSMRSEDLKVRAKKSSDLYFKTEGVEFWNLFLRFCFFYKNIIFIFLYKNKKN